MFDRSTPHQIRVARQTRRAPLVLTAVAALLGALSVGVPTASAATPSTMVPACSAINIRSGTSTSSSVRTTLSANATLTVAGTVSGGSWKATCPTARSGSTWYRIAAINGKTVIATYGKTYLCAAAAVLRAAPSPAAATSDPLGADLMRVINLDRKTLGKAPYIIDG